MRHPLGCLVNLNEKDVENDMKSASIVKMQRAISLTERDIEKAIEKLEKLKFSLVSGKVTYEQRIELINQAIEELKK